MDKFSFPFSPHYSEVARGNMLRPSEIWSLLYSLFKISLCFHSQQNKSSPVAYNPVTSSSAPSLTSFTYYPALLSFHPISLAFLLFLNMPSVLCLTAFPLGSCIFICLISSDFLLHWVFPLEHSSVLLQVCSLSSFRLVFLLYQKILS